MASRLLPDGVPKLRAPLKRELCPNGYNAHCHPDDAVNRVAGASGSALSPGYKEAYNYHGRINPGRSRDRSSADDATGAIGATDIRPPDESDGILHRHRSKVCLVGISA